MPTRVPMPQLGESVHEATLTRWLKAPGDPVSENEPLLELNTDKVDTEIAAPASGVLLAALAEEGATVKVGETLAWIGQPGEAYPGGTTTAPAPVKSISAPAAAPAAALLPAQLPVSQPVEASAREVGFISPVVGRIAAEHNLDLSLVPGTGLGGRITKKDVLAFLEQPRSALPAAPQPAAIAQPPAVSQPVSVLPGEGELVTLGPVRRLIAEHMVQSKTVSPHVTTVMEVDMSLAVAHRQAHKEAFARDGVNLTFTAYFVAASVAALKAYPVVNSSWTEQGLLIHKHIHIGMSTSLGDEGLIVPVLKDADSLSLLGLARMVNDLANRARTKKLQPDEVKGGTFTITNHGISGSLFATPIINQPQCAILGVGVLQKRPVVISDKNLGDVIAIRPMLYISLTFDHRILDGAIADYFLGKVVETLQNWS